MTEFDKKLNVKLHEFRRDTGDPTYKIAKDAGIGKDTLYKFLAGKRSLNGENTKKLMDYLNLTVELKEKNNE